MKSLNNNYAGFWIRFGASIIDMVIMVLVIYVPLSLIYGDQYGNEDQLIHGVWDVLLGYVVPIFATIWFWLKYMATPGKIVTKLKVVDAVSGQKMSTIQATIRYFAYIPAAIPLGLGFIWVGIDKKKQGWHDKLAGTVVVRNRENELS